MKRVLPDRALNRTDQQRCCWVPALLRAVAVG